MLTTLPKEHLENMIKRYTAMIHQTVASINATTKRKNPRLDILKMYAEHLAGHCAALNHAKMLFNDWEK